MGPGLFFGLILVVIGISIIFRIIFDINIFRIAIALVFIFAGITILVGKPFFHREGHENHVIFGERTYHSSPFNGAEYNTIFGRTVFDFRDQNILVTSRTKITMNTIFGSTEVLLPPGIPVHIKADAVFSSATLPNGNTVAFGSAHYSSGDSVGAPALVIEANVVFGGLEIKQ